MPLSPAFTVGNNDVVASQFTVVDTSTGSDASIVNRLIYIFLSDNSLFTGAPIQFPLSAGDTITPNILISDFAWSIQIQWVDANGVMVEQASQIGAFTGFLESFEYGLVQQIAANNSIINDKNFLDNLGNIRTFIDDAQLSIDYGQSVYNAEAMILLAQYLSTNSTLFF